jgi:PAT family beta-lactamase induction signal transducer AmpG
MRSLLISGILQMLSNLMFAVQAIVGPNLMMLTLTIGIENLAGGMGTAAFVAYLSSLCSVAYTATQYALLSALMSFPRTLLSSSSGWLAEQLDWVNFFLLTTVAALPGLLLLLWLMRREVGTEQEQFMDEEISEPCPVPSSAGED